MGRFLLKGGNVLITACLTVVLSACGGADVYEKEAFGQATPYQQVFPFPSNQTCEAAERALLSHAYRIVERNTLSLRALKEFQPDDEINKIINIDITCKEANDGTAVYINAVQTTYKLKKTSGATSLSVSGAGSFSFPWSKSTDSLVKVAGETITDKHFYSRFFALLESYLIPAGK